MTRLEPELQTATWELIRALKKEPDASIIQEVVDSIKEAIASGWQERTSPTDTNSREPERVCPGESTVKIGVTRTGRTLERRSHELGNLCRWAGRISTWDAEAIALVDDELCLKRHLKAARQLKTFCETFIEAIMARLSNTAGK